MLFEDKVALVTGGAAGIGRASALAFAREGATVLVSDVDDAGGEETVRLIEEHGGRADYLHVDVRDAEAVAGMVQTAVEQFGGLHYAVNNAGIAGDIRTRIPDIEIEMYDRIMDINVKGVWLCLKYEIPALLASGGGAIVNVASVAGVLGNSGAAIYAASKHAVIGLTKSAALEFPRKNIRVNAVCPAFTETAMVMDVAEQYPPLMEKILQTNPMRRLGKVEEISGAVVWLCSAAASFVNGHAMVIDGGLSQQ